MAEDYKKAFIDRTNQHIERVNKFAKIIGKSYPKHDADKFNELFDGYSLMNKKDVTKEEQAKIDNATYLHVLNNDHHCEHWCDPADIEGFSRENPTPHGCLDCSEMPEYALEEMCYKARRDMYSDYGGHGRVWKDIAKEVGEYTNQNITRTNSYSMHTEVGKAYDDKIKYVVRCKHCGREFKYTKMTKFIKDVIDGEGHSDNWWCCCDDGTKSHDFEIVKGK